MATVDISGSNNNDLNKPFRFEGPYKSAKLVWLGLEKKYDTQEVGTKKYVVSRYLKYQMTDDKLVESQSHEIQKIAHDIISEGMALDEQFQVVVIIDKLPPGWKDFKNLLRHKTKEFPLESLLTRLHIEEEAHRQDRKDEVLVVSHNNTKRKNTGAVLKPIGKNFKNQNRNVSNTSNRNKNPPRVQHARQHPLAKNNPGESFLCYNCGKPGHMARKCRNPSMTEIENQFNKKIKKLRSDIGTEYDSSLLNEFYNLHGIIHETTAPYSPEMNGKAERKNITFTELVVATMLSSSATSFWDSGGTSSSYLPAISSENLAQPELDIEPRRGKRARIAKDYGPNYMAYTLEEDPSNLQEVLSSLDADLWQEAITDEMDSLESNKTWHLVDLPSGCKPIGCKWILKKKLKPDGTVDKYKARLVAKGFRQRENVDFFDTFSLVTRIKPIRVLISLAAIHSLVVHQMDVKTAFLNDELEEEIYMEQPEGVVIHGQEDKVCKLDKSLYGLKQAPKQWHEKFDNLIVSNGFKVNESDKCIYYKSINNICTIICVYVDDLLIFGSNIHVVNDVKSLLCNNFDMKDLGEASVILGIKITRSKEGISLDQSHYIEKILKKYDYFDSKPASTSYDPSVKLFKNTGEGIRQTEYASIIGSLRYATDCTRPDIAYVVGLLCRFTSRLSMEHWHAIERVMRYLKRTINLGLHYKRFLVILEGYNDADWNTLSDDSKATNGYIFSIAATSHDLGPPVRHGQACHMQHSRSGCEPQYNLLHVDGWAVGQEGEAPLPRSLLTLGLHVSDAEVEVTTLILGPPGLEKEAIEKAKLDLHLKI
ncbi:Retrovirus-related Pol polyprotein from transposon TNT 1-94 [Glycine soja]|uniref:Retrovirus-related Pol polyprotein from transposon TNT 1-94 n=1 Tax=Glycine soja TaxID=3848 RepID=A0A445IZL0_GLYSO|nr:Retrovirus-related Pol polyprotein from transposon TNT 1-94 [Glycine soja]